MRNLFKKKEKKNSSVSKIQFYGLFNYNEKDNKYKLIFVYKDLIAPIALISYDLIKIKQLAELMEPEENCILTIRKIESLTIQTGETID